MQVVLKAAHRWKTPGEREPSLAAEGQDQSYLVYLELTVLSRITLLAEQPDMCYRWPESAQKT